MNALESPTAIIEIDEDGEHVLVFPDGFLETIGWEIGDNIVFSVESDGKVIMKKIDIAESLG
jgi:bifunctional DNA-binding transcriptional regulator/antitoxin component of YhaV-PrlF toxin-antitoxin module